MANYHFKHKCKVYMHGAPDNWNFYVPIDVYPDLSFSQTFDEQARNVKTLHDQNAMFEDAVLNRANPANFNLTCLLKGDEGSQLIMEYAIKTNSSGNQDGSFRYISAFDLYVDTGVDIFKIEFCAIERVVIQFSRNELVTANLSGTARKVSIYGPSGTVLPGAQAAEEVETVAGIINKAFDVQFDNEIQPNIASVSLEIANEIEWLNYDTLHKSLYVAAPSDTMYPEAFVVSKRRLSGTIVQYVTDTNDARLQSWDDNSSILIKTGETSANYFLTVNIPKAIITNRIQTDEIFVQVSDYRMTSQTSLASVIDFYF